MFTLPSVLSALVEPLASIVDTALVGNYSTDYLAAMAVCITIFSSLTWVFNFLIHITTQKLADFTTLEDESLITQRFFIAVASAGIVSILVVGILIIFREKFYLFAGAEAARFKIMDEYYGLRSHFHFFTIFNITLMAVLRSFGFVKESFYAVLLMTVSNILISYFCLYHTSLGIKGVALGTVGAHAIGVIYSVCYLLKKKFFLFSQFFKVRAGKTEWLSFGEGSFNIFGRSFILTSCFFFGTKVATEMGTTEIASYQILLQLWLFCSFFIDGVASSANILLANSDPGKGDERSELSFKFVLISAVLGFIFLLLYWIFDREILRLFTKDQDVLRLSLLAMPLIYSSQVISSLAFVYDGIIFGLAGFAYLRRHMIIGALIVFYPCLVYGKISDQYIWIWVGFISLNIYRALSGRAYVKNNI